MELGPVDVPRELLRLLRVEATRRLDGRERRGVVAPRVAQRAQVPVLRAQEVAERVERVRVVVLIVDAVAEVERALVVDLDEDDGPLGPAQPRELLADGAVPARRLLEERVARVARHRERDGHHRQHDGVTARRARLAIGVPDDALGQAEERHLRVDVRPRAHHALQADLVRHTEEARHVEARVPLAEVVLAGRRLVHAPRDVGVDEPQPHRAHRLETRPPLAARVPPVVHRAGPERQHLAVAEVEPVRDADARALPTARALGSTKSSAGRAAARHGFRERDAASKVPSDAHVVVVLEAREAGAHLGDRRLDEARETTGFASRDR